MVSDMGVMGFYRFYRLSRSIVDGLGAGNMERRHLAC